MVSDLDFGPRGLRVSPGFGHFLGRCLTLAVPLCTKQQNVIIRGNADGPVMDKHSVKWETKQYS